MTGKIATNGVVLAYDLYGDPDAPTLIGLQGLAEGRKFWPQSLVRTLTDAGYRLLLVDNRDIGDSSILYDAGRVDLAGLVAGSGAAAPYNLKDLAVDIVGIMDGLAIPKAHVMGYSLGGMIAQWMAIDHPHRVQSLALVMSSSNAPDLPAADPQAGASLFELAAPGCGDLHTRIEALWHAMQGEFPRDGTWFVDQLAKCGYRPDAVNRQLAAGLATPPRHDKLYAVKCPCLVLHGTHDAIFPLGHGEDLAMRIPGATLVRLSGAGHALTDDIMSDAGKALLAHLNQVEGTVV